MERSLLLFISYTIVLAATAFDIPEECLVSPEWEGKWNSTSMKLSFWVPPSGDEANSSTSFLSVKLTGRKKIDKYIFIEFWKSHFPTTYSGSKVANEIPQTHRVEVSSEGWMDLLLESGDEMRVLNAEGKELLSLNESLQPDSLVVVRGRFMTVNCRKPVKVWSLAADSGTSRVPLFSRDHSWSRLTLYSETPSSPRLRLSEDSNTFLLGWDGKSVCAVTEDEFGDGCIPLPPSVQHNLTIGCRKEAVAVFCDVLSGTEGRSIWSVQLVSIPESLSVQASSEEHLYVLLHCEVPLSLQEELKGSSRREKTAGQVVALVIIGLVFVSIVLLVVVSSLQHDRVMGLAEKRPSFGDIFPVNEESESSGEDESESPLLPPRGSVIMEEQTLWEAVEKDDVEAVRHLLDQGYHPDDLEGDRISSPFMDAHLLGRREIVDIFASLKGETYTTAQDDLVKSVLYELERNMKEIFLAAEVGMYTHEQGVKALLKDYSLPATICDSHGRSLLHYMVSVNAMDGVPPWQPKDMRNFFSSHEFVANAVDHRGRTALHELSQHPRTVETDVIWDGKEWTLPEAWLALARLLVSNGCDPRIPDHKGRRPQELAQEAGNVELAHFLEEKCSELDNNDRVNGIDHFDDLVSAARQGDTSRLQGLLKRTPLLPVSAREDPLVVAIRHHQRDAMFMLLAAGAPIVNRSVGEVTPLEAAHNTLGLAACFPAVLRKVFCERMEDEISRVSQEDETLKPLRQSMTAYNLQVMDVGSRARWIFQAKDEVTRSQEARRLLLQASALGLSISCQLLGLENYYLHSLPGKPNPFQKAVEEGHTQIQLALYRDLGMSPFTVDTPHDFFWFLLEDFWTHELKTLENLCQKESKVDARINMQNHLQDTTTAEEERLPDQGQDTSEGDMCLLLYILAKHGLVTILHVILNHFRHLEIDKVVQRHYRYTMMHIAAAFGRMNIIEYLLHKGASTVVLCIGSYTPAHVAAITGHKKCFEYLQEYMKVVGMPLDIRCSIGLTALEMMNKYEDLCTNYTIPQLPHDTALLIKNEENEQTQAFEIVKRRGTILNISSISNLLQQSKAKCCVEMDTEYINRFIQTEIHSLEKLLNESGCQGAIIPVGSFHEGFEVFDTIEINFLYEISNAGVQENLSFEDFVDEDRIIMAVESDSKNSYYSGNAFLSTFLQNVLDVLVKFMPGSPYISLVPPFANRAPDGVYLFWMIVIKDQIKLIRTLIMPVLPLTCPYDDVSTSLPPNLIKDPERKSNLPLHLLSHEGEWVYCAYTLEGLAFQNLTKNQRTVWVACIMLRRLLQNTWWSPSFNFRNPTKLWHTLSLGLELLPERGMRSLFLAELAESQEWDKHQLPERLISVFSRACKRDLREKLVPKEYINSFITPRHFCCRVKESVCGVLQYLEELPEIEQQAQDKVVKFAEL
ncbi:LOW QUALITY PROTEIN: uncharacterized protein [Macrobrachium rosenbergii]|uniref:LOW QUALITY PROTEIN: uncharacterized protein n=1 Tax=Macrobrachium rosenbergii TaxID=79674 RepID=UPI0034D4330F